MINFITVDNGVGLSADMRILADSLGIKYNFIDFKSNVSARGDTNVFFEVINKRHLHSLNKNILIPNPEWFASEWLGLLYMFDAVYCKTKHCYETFKKYVGDKAIYTGWTSEDRYLNVDKHSGGFLHTAGKSETKGTRNTIKAFDLVNASLIVTTNKHDSLHTKIPNVKIVDYRLNETNFRQLQNMMLFHVCCSEYEGFGHYINEAKSTGAIIISTDAAPMNELCTKDFSILCQADKYRLMGIVDTWSVPFQNIARAVNECLSLTDAEKKRMSEDSRQSYLDNDKNFRTKIKEIW